MSSVVLLWWWGLWESLERRYISTGLHKQTTLKASNFSLLQFTFIVIQNYFDRYFSWFWKLISDREVKCLNMPRKKLLYLRIEQAIDDKLLLLSWLFIKIYSLILYVISVARVKGTINKNNCQFRVFTVQYYSQSLLLAD